MIFTKTRQVKSPCRANPTDSGIDFYIPEYTPEFVKEIKEKSMSEVKVTEDNKSLILEPGDNLLIPLGIKVIVDEGQSLVAFNKSGIGAKKGLGHIAEVVDQGYTGEVHLNMINLSNKTQTIDFGSKAIQFLQLRIDQHMPSEVTAEEYDAIVAREVTSARGDGGFGSTGV